MRDWQELAAQGKKTYEENEKVWWSEMVEVGREKAQVEGELRKLEQMREKKEREIVERLMGAEQNFEVEQKRMGARWNEILETEEQKEQDTEKRRKKKKKEKEFLRCARQRQV